MTEGLGPDKGTRLYLHLGRNHPVFFRFLNLTPQPPPGKGTQLRFNNAACALDFALTPSPSPTAWERGVEGVRGAVGSPSPTPRERGQGVRAKNAAPCLLTELSRRTLVSQPPLRKRRGGAGGAWHERSPLSACGEGGKEGEVGENGGWCGAFEPSRCTLISYCVGGT